MKGRNQHGEISPIPMHIYQMDVNSANNPNLQNQLGRLNNQINKLENQQAPRMAGTHVGSMAQALQQQAGYQTAQGGRADLYRSQGVNDWRTQQALARSWWCFKSAR